MDRVRMTSNAAVTAVALAAVPAVLDKAVAGTTRRYGSLLRTRVRARASGRPGPRRQTGDYRRGIGLETGAADGVHYAVVGTNSPQGRRLELGFVGADSRGRHFRQPPYPHFGPALDETDPQYVAAVAADVARVLGVGGVG